MATDRGFRSAACAGETEGRLIRARGSAVKRRGVFSRKCAATLLSREYCRLFLHLRSCRHAVPKSVSARSMLLCGSGKAAHRRWTSFVAIRAPCLYLVILDHRVTNRP